MLQHKLKVRSWPTKGTVFSVDVPLGDPALAVKQKPQQRGWIRSKGLNGVNVLVIDNEPKIIEGMSALLTGWSCEVRTALSIQESVEACSDDSFTPDIMLVDYHLGETDTGIMALKELAKLGLGEVPAIIITADRTDEVKAEITEHGAILLNKPVKPAALRQLISKNVAK
jgi:CheY-like chemotaxis protein